MKTSFLLLLTTLISFSLSQRLQNGIINQIPLTSGSSNIITSQHPNKKPLGLGNIKIIKQNPTGTISNGLHQTRQIITTTNTPIITTTTQQPGSYILANANSNIGRCKIGGRYKQKCMSIYENDGFDNSFYKKRYSCYNKARCVYRNGECKWVQTKKFKKCMNNLTNRNNNNRYNRRYYRNEERRNRMF